MCQYWICLWCFASNDMLVSSDACASNVFLIQIMYLFLSVILFLVLITLKRRNLLRLLIGEKCLIKLLKKENDKLGFSLKEPTTKIATLEQVLKSSAKHSKSLSKRNKIFFQKCDKLLKQKEWLKWGTKLLRLILRKTEAYLIVPNKRFQLLENGSKKLNKILSFRQSNKRDLRFQDSNILNKTFPPITKFVKSQNIDKSEPKLN